MQMLSPVVCSSFADKQASSYVFGCDCIVGDCRNELATADGRKRALDWFARHHVTKVYVESFRHGEAVPTEHLRTIRDEFAAAGLVVGGCFTPTSMKLSARAEKGGKMDYQQWCCYTDAETREVLRTEVARAAGLFDFVIIDDFLFTHCECAGCRQAKGDRTWTDFRCALMTDVCRDIDRTAKKANPKCTFIVKFPCWYGGYRTAGYDIATQSRILGASWVGTETRDEGPATQAFWLQAWANEATDGLCGGGWFDALMTSDPSKYVEQARYTILGGAKETILHCYSHLGAPEPKPDPDHPYLRIIRWHACAEAFRQEVEGLELLASYVRGARLIGIPLARPVEATGSDRAVDILCGGVPVRPVVSGGVAYPFADEKTYAGATPAGLKKVHDWVTEKTGVSLDAPGNVTLHLYEKDGQRYAAVVNVRIEPVEFSLIAGLKEPTLLLALPKASYAHRTDAGKWTLARRSMAFFRLDVAENMANSTVTGICAAGSSRRPSR